MTVLTEERLREYLQKLLNWKQENKDIDDAGICVYCGDVERGSCYCMRDD